METMKRSVSTLQHYHQNARRGNVDAIAESLTANGQYKPIVVNAGTHTGRPDEVLVGNHTLDAAVALGWEHLDVVVVDVTDAHARRIVLADNRTSDLATYDSDALIELLQGSDDLSGTGYDSTFLDDLSAHLADVDLDGMADRWDGSGLLTGDWSEKIKLTLTDKALLEQWEAHRKNHKTDTLALAALLNE